MTKEELEILINQGARTTLIKNLAGLDEQERKKLSTTASKLLKELDRERDRVWREQWGGNTKPKPPSAELTRLFEVCTSRATLEEKLETAETAALGVCPISVTKKIEVRKRDANKSALVAQVLIDRKPEWIDEWLEERMKGDWPTIEWQTYWKIRCMGACNHPTSEAYYRFLAWQLGGTVSFVDNRKVPLNKLLREEPELQEDMWKFFEIETNAFSWDRGVNEDGERESWGAAICKLARQGVLDRGRLLDAALSGLTRGFKLHVLSGYSTLYERLEPTLKEANTRQMAFIDLLSVSEPQVVNFSLNQLKAIDKSKQLDERAFVAGAGAAFGGPTKTPAKTTLSLLKKIGKRSPELRPRIIEELIESALQHPADEIVTAAIDLVAHWPAELSDAAAESLAAAMTDLPATAQAKARELLSSASVDVEAHDPAAVDEREVAKQLDELKKAASEVAEPWRTLAGVGDAVAAIDLEAWPGPLEFSPLDVPVLSGVEPIASIETQDELFDVVAHAVEEVTNPADFDRIIDAISRLGREETPEFERLAAPLAKRIRDRPYDEAGRSLVTWGKVPVEFVRLLNWWLCGDPDASREKEHAWQDGWWNGVKELTPAHRWLNAHFSSVRLRLERGQQGPLLSTPTHAEGWIDSLALVARWSELTVGETELLETDASLAFLRLSPERRILALKQAKSLSRAWCPALRWALGDDTSLEKFSEVPQQLWVSAANARGDEVSFEQLQNLGLVNSGPDVSLQARYEWKAPIKEWLDPIEKKITVRHAELKFENRPKLPKIGTECDLLPLLLHSHEEPDFWHDSKWMISYLACLHPGNISYQYVTGCLAMMIRIDDTGSNWDTNFPYLNVLFAVDRPMDDLACLLLTIGLAGRDQDVRGLAIDAAIESIADGRLHPAVWGPVLATLNEPGWLKLNRLGPNLAEVARVGPLHSLVVLQTVDCLVAAYDSMPRDATHLLELFHELLVGQGGTASPEAAEVLAKVKGSSKTAKLAKAILTCDALDTTAAQQARLELLDCRIARSRRWEGAVS